MSVAIPTIRPYASREAWREDIGRPDEHAALWDVLDRDTGELIDTAAPGSQMDKALLAGSPAVLFGHEVAHNILSGEVIY